MCALRAGSAASKQDLQQYVGMLLKHSNPMAQLGRWLGTKLTRDEKEEVGAVLEHHSRKLAAGRSEKLVCKGMLKPLYGLGAKGSHKALDSDPVEPMFPRLRDVLMRRGSKEKLRSIAKNKRVKQAVTKWPTGKLQQAGVACMERAIGRLEEEHPEWGGRPTTAFMRGLVHTGTLPTAVGSAADHYVLVEKGGDVRWLSVPEQARAMEVPRGNPLMKGLTGRSLTAAQAGIALGNGIHVASARSLVRSLVRRGQLRTGMTYGSSWSGVDTFAAAVEEEMRGEWRYEFASEKKERLRDALLASWGARGLTRARCHADATGKGAVGERYVDLWVASPECTPYSPLNRLRSLEEQRDGMRHVAEGIRYIERALPRVAIVENVSEASVVGPLGAMLGSMAKRLGYAMGAGQLNAKDLGALSARKRHFWVLEKK